MRRIVFPLFVTIILAANIYGRKHKVLIQLDYNKRPEWSYTLDYHSECIITENDSTSRINTRVLCGMIARPMPRGDRMTFTINSAEVVSGLFDKTQQKNIVQKLTGASFGLALSGGCPMVDTLTSFSVNELSEWDLVIQFAKLLPFVPNVPVKKGYKWDESGIHPIQTTLGKVYCEIYRLYKIDSLSTSGSRVHISWEFKYASARLSVDTIDVLRKVPVEGKGKGTAVINIKEQFLERANIQFLTPVASMGTMKIYWKENTLLNYIPEH